MPNNPNVDIGAVRQEIAKKAGVEAPKVEATAAVMQRTLQEQGGRATLEGMKNRLPVGVTDAQRDSAVGENIQGTDAAQDTKRTEAKASIDKANKYVKEYGALGVAEKQAFQDTIRGQLSSI